MMSDKLVSDLGDFLTTDNAEPLNLCSEVPKAGKANRSKFMVTAICGGLAILPALATRGAAGYIG
jgi:hypothetical protein